MRVRLQACRWQPAASHTILPAADDQTRPSSRQDRQAPSKFPPDFPAAFITSYPCRSLADDRSEADASPSPEGAFPNGQMPPAGGVQLRGHFRIARSVTRDLPGPEFSPGAWKTEQRAVMPVPKASMDEYDGPVARECHIGTARNVASMQPVSETEGVQGLADSQFRAGILAPDTRHHTASGLLIDHIRQWPPFVWRLRRSGQPQATTAPCAAPRPPRPAQRRHCQTGDRPAYPRRG